MRAPAARGAASTSGVPVSRRFVDPVGIRFPLAPLCEGAIGGFSTRFATG